MRYIGRIIANTKLEDIPEFIDVTKDLPDKDEEIRIPTLIIGYNNVKKVFGEFDITEKRIKGNLKWTFSKRERRSDYISGLKDFYEDVFKFIIGHCRYEYIDMISADKERKHHITEIFSSEHIKIIYQTDRMYYIYYPKEGTVYGVSKDVLAFLGFDENILAERIDNKRIFSCDNDFSLFESKETPSFTVPMLYYLKTF